MRLGLIPARGGSKRVPGKNMRKLGGIPLVGWAITCALRSRSIDCVVVSSDDDRTLQYAEDSGVVPLKRPAVYASDTASSYWAMTHALENWPADSICVLQPTSPFRQPVDVDGCYDMAISKAAPAAVTVEFGKSEPNGAVYWAKSQWLLAQLAQGDPAPFDGSLPVWHPMPSDRSLDINTENDWSRAVRLLEAYAA